MALIRSLDGITMVCRVRVLVLVLVSLLLDVATHIEVHGVGRVMDFLREVDKPILRAVDAKTLDGVQPHGL